MNPRVAQFVIKPTMDATNNACTQGVRFTVTQKGRNLLASTDKVEMFKSGGTSATYTITADGKYSISKPDADNWYVLQHDEKARSFTLYLSENRTDDTRESQLTISLVELPEGEVKQVLIPVTQYAGGANIDVDVNGWGDDRDWLATTGTLNGHECVDLGLPSGIKWATCNVGATAPEEYGGYYAWGETEEKDDYSWSTYKWCNGSYNTMTKYCTNSSYGTVDNKTTLDLEDDVAHVKWGGSWRMPTGAEQQELLNNCTWTWTTQNDVYGYKVTSKTNGNSIFLPAAGLRHGTGLDYSGSDGLFWSGSLYESYNNNAYYMYFYSSGYYDFYYDYRYNGRSVRPVTE